MRKTYFKDKLTTAFDGIGQSLGGERIPSRLVPSKMRSNSIPEGAHVTSTPPGRTPLFLVLSLSVNTNCNTQQTNYFERSSF